MAAGQYRGLYYVKDYKNGLVNSFGYKASDEINEFYKGYVQGYNDYMFQDVTNVDISEENYIDINKAKNMVNYTVTQTPPAEQKTGSSDKIDVDPNAYYDYWNPFGGSGSSGSSGGGSGSSETQQQAATDVQSTAVITDLSTGKKETVTTKKGGSGLSMPIMIGLGAGAVLLVLLLLKK
jgi:hypothetical protein